MICACVHSYRELHRSNRNWRASEISILTTTATTFEYQVVTAVVFVVVVVVVVVVEGVGVVVK